VFSVRTTLKRGIGRATSVDGNGHAVLPPGATTPVSRYWQPPPPPRSILRLVGQVFFWSLVALLMVAGAFAGGLYLWGHEKIGQLQAHSTDVKAAQRNLDLPPPPSQAAIGLVIGYDHRAGEGNAPSRSDTLMLLRADPRTKSISMLSFPRDMAVPIHCPGHSVFVSKINSAYATCGSKGTLETMKALTGLPINYLITVNFRGFKRIVNQLGGVWLDVDRRYFNDNSGLGSGFGYATINLQPGYQRLTGGGALDFVRFRHTDSDFYRVARQQLFVTAMKEQFRRSFSIFKVPKLVNTVTHNVEVGQGGGKAISAKTVLRYAYFLWKLPGGHFFQARIDGLTGQFDLSTSSSSIDEAVREFVSPDVEAPKVANAVALGNRPKTVAPKPSETTIGALNGNNVPGSASNARYLLGQRGYQTVDPPANATGNAPSFGYNHTVIYYDPRLPRSQAAAREAAKLFAPADVQRLTSIIRPLSNGAMLTVVVGATFHNELAPAPLRPEIVRHPPVVIFNRAATEPLLRGVKKKVPFRLEVPNVIDSGSIPDPEKPIRVYRIEGSHRAVRLTFRTGGNQYWGVEETNWEDAPVFGDRSFDHVLDGRRYSFYYHGSHLHMIVLHEHGSTYWVVNTLLGSLSNETMIAIAKGLRPLDQPAAKKVKKAKKAKAKKKGGQS
jgi:LCP family protein required for cell wall assembly